MSTYKVKDVRRYIIREEKSKVEITRARTIERAEEIIKQFMEEDKKDRNYRQKVLGENIEEIFYEIVDSRTNEIIK